MTPLTKFIIQILSLLCLQFFIVNFSVLSPHKITKNDSFIFYENVALIIQQIIIQLMVIFLRDKNYKLKPKLKC